MKVQWRGNWEQFPISPSVPIQVINKGFENFHDGEFMIKKGNQIFIYLLFCGSCSNLMGIKYFESTFQNRLFNSFFKVNIF